MKKVKKIIWAAVIVFVVCLSLMLVYNLIIVNNSEGKVSSVIEQATKNPRACEDDKTNKPVQHPDTIYSFFGKQVIQNDSVIEQIAAIAKRDKMLSYSDSIIQICNVKWRINLTPGNGVVLLTSVDRDAPQIKEVENYLNEIYGKPYDVCDGGDNLKWSSSPDSLDIFKGDCTLVMLRRIHSEEGGSIITFF